MSNKISAAQVKQTIIYLNLLSLIPPKRVAELPSVKGDFGEAWPLAVEAASRLIVAFHQASRDPESELVIGLARAALRADSSPDECRAFQEQMRQLAKLPGRAKEVNRLHRKRGCLICEAPCRYGYFSLISEPNFDELQNLLEVDNARPPQQRQPVQVVWRFTLNHLLNIFQTGKWHISADHLGNLSYCLVALATAKSRYRFPEEQIRKFQAMNQDLIQHYQNIKTSEK